VVPKHEFDWGKRQWGAVEIAARLSHLDLDDGDIRGGRQTNATLSLNWYALSNVRVGVNAIWGHVAGDGDVLIGQTRLQIDF
jgi:phosphate-selective porin OprO/OprP